MKLFQEWLCWLPTDSLSLLKQYIYQLSWQTEQFVCLKQYIIHPMTDLIINFKNCTSDKTWSVVNHDLTFPAGHIHRCKYYEAIIIHPSMTLGKNFRYRSDPIQPSGSNPLKRNDTVGGGTPWSYVAIISVNWEASNSYLKNTNSYELNRIMWSRNIYCHTVTVRNGTWIAVLHSGKIYSHLKW